MSSIWKTSFLFLLGSVGIGCEVPVSKSDVAGTYVNTNYSTERCCVEAPHTADTLTLKDDGTFTSGFYGNGEYSIDGGLLSTRISWIYTYEIGKASYSTVILRDLTGSSPRIILNYDLNHYYEKVK